MSEPSPSAESQSAGSSGNESAREPAVVVVTGIGAVSAYGPSAEALWQGLLGESSVAPAQRFDVEGHRTAIVSEIVGEQTACEESRKRDSRADRFAVEAAREAAKMAGVDFEKELTGLFFGGSTAGMAEGERYFGALLDDEARPPASRRAGSAAQRSG